MKLLKNLAFTAASLALFFATVNVKSASAAIVTYAFSVDSSIKTGKGIFSFDDETFSNDIFPATVVKSLSFQFDGDSNIYTEKDDIAFPDFPIVSLSYTGNPSVQLSYFFLDKANPSEFLYEVVGNDFTILAGDTQNTEIGFGSVTYAKVPEPANAIGILMVLGLGLMLNKPARQFRRGLKSL